MQRSKVGVEGRTCDTLRQQDLISEGTPLLNETLFWAPADAAGAQTRAQGFKPDTSATVAEEEHGKKEKWAVLCNKRGGEVENMTAPSGLDRHSP